MKGKAAAGGAALVLLACMLTGCQDSREAMEARLTGIGQMNQGDYEGAIASFDTALSEADGIVGAFELDILKYRAEAEYMTEDYAAAAHTYGILADVDGKQPEYLYYRAASLALGGSLEEAEAAYQEASQKKEESSQEAAGTEAGRSLALSAIGKAYEDQGMYQEAMEFYEQAKASGTTADLYNRMGLCMMASGDYERAISYFQEGMTLGDEVKMPDLRYNEAVAYEYKGNFEKALELLNAYVSDYGSTPELEKEIAFLQTR